MNPELTLSLAFLTGLAGAGHCWVMCGPMVGGLFLAGAGSATRLAHFAYHAGRILAYTLLGGLAALLGQALVLTGGVGRAQGLLYVLAGLLVILAGARVAGWLPLPKTMQDRAPRWSLAGFINGLLPCSLVFSLSLKAATAPDPFTGAAWLFAFGLGTVPAMALAAVLAHGLGIQSLVWLRRSSGLLVMLLGGQAVWAGARFFSVMLHL